MSAHATQSRSLPPTILVLYNLPSNHGQSPQQSTTHIMVRFKSRYLLFNILYPNAPCNSNSNSALPTHLDFNAPTDPSVTGHALVSLIRDAITMQFGDCGSGMTSSLSGTTLAPTHPAQKQKQVSNVRPPKSEIFFSHHLYWHNPLQPRRLPHRLVRFGAPQRDWWETRRLPGRQG